MTTASMAGDLELHPAFELGVDSFAQSFEITDQLIGDLEGVDIITNRALRDTTEVFTEYRALADLGLRYSGAHSKLAGRAYLSLGSDVIREGAAFDLRMATAERSQRFELSGDVDARQFQPDSDYALASDLEEYKFRGRWRGRFAEGLFVGLRGRAEWTEYDQRSEFELDRRRAEFSATGRIERGFDLSWDVEAGGGHTAVPDSSEISFDRGFLYSDVSARLGDRLRASLYAAFDRRSYSDPSIRSSTWDVLVEPELVWRTQDDGRIRASMSLERLEHDEPTNLYFDLIYGRAALLFEMVRGSWTLGAEPRWSWLDSPSDVEDQFVQPSLALKLDYFGLGKLWLSLTEELGRRDYPDASDPDLRLYSDYFFVRTTLLLSYQIHERVRVEGFLSDEPESHQLVEDDSRLTLLNLSVRCSL